MAKKSAIQTNLNRAKINKSLASKRKKLKLITMSRDLPIEERFQAQIKLAEMPRNSASIRLRNRCQITGRPRGFYRRFGLSRILLRELASSGDLPGVKKSSW